MVHQLKVWTEYFNDLQLEKNFEVRKNDRDFKVGDRLFLVEWDNEKEEYTGNIIDRKVTYILYGGQFGIEEGYCVMSLK